MPYVQYSFTEDELTVAASFTDLQQMYLETRLAEIAQERVNLSYNPDSHESKDRYILEGEYLRGQLEVLHLLLNTSQECKDRQKELLERQIASQQDDHSSFTSY